MERQGPASRTASASRGASPYDGLPVLRPSGDFRIEYLSWFIVASGEQSKVAGSAANARARLVKVRIDGQSPPAIFWVRIPVGNCGACRFHASGFPGRCTNPAMSEAQYEDHLKASDCSEFAIGACVTDPSRRQDVLSSLILRVETVLGLDPVVRDEAGRRIAMPPVTGLTILQELAYTPWGSFLASQQQQRFQDIARDLDTGFDMEYDPRSDLGTIDATAPTPAEYQLVQPQVNYFLANPKRIPARAWQ